MWSAKIHFTRRNCVYILWAPIIKTVNRNAWISVVTCVLCHPLIPAPFNIHVFSRAFWKVRWNKFSVWLATAAFVGGKNSCRNLMMVVKKNSLQMALICRIEWKFTANLGCGVNVCVCFRECEGLGDNQHRRTNKLPHLLLHKWNIRLVLFGFSWHFPKRMALE